ncbi:unnamed protein product, partial [Mesorhabditis belari]|uniref:Uncharacterized protein n=1 Tax=Mesorhabditis belari TaxID=2138241 RepID=A0AAF3F2E7_9BILA
MAVIDAQAPQPTQPSQQSTDAPQPSLIAAPTQALSQSDLPVTVTSLAHKYRAEFEQTLDGLRQRALKLQEQAPELISQTQANIEPYKKDFVDTVQALGEVVTPPLTILQTLSWSAVLVLASTIASYASAYVFAPILSLAIGGFGALGLALAAVPMYTAWTIQEDLAAKATDMVIRFHLLAAALVEGLLVGLLLQNSYLSGAPLADVLLAITAVAYPFAADKVGHNRQMLLGASVGTSVGVTLLLGLLSGYFTLPYLVLTLLYGAITAVTLQYIYKNVTSTSAPTYTYQLALLVAFTAANLGAHLQPVPKCATSELCLST